MPCNCYERTYVPRCRLCFSTGHTRAAECPQRLCSKCHFRGHLARECFLRRAKPSKAVSLADFIQLPEPAAAAPAAPAAPARSGTKANKKAGNERTPRRERRTRSNSTASASARVVVEARAPPKPSSKNI